MIKNEHDLIRRMGRFPDKILKAGTAGMMSTKWTCSKCGYVTESEKPIRPPSPCVRCNGIFFQK